MIMWNGTDWEKQRLTADRKHGANLAFYKNMVADNMAALHGSGRNVVQKEEVRWAKVTDRKGRGMLFEMES